MFTSISIRDNHLTDHQWRDLYSLHLILRQKYKSNLTASSWEGLKEHTLALLKREPGFNRSVILRDNRMVAWVQLAVRHVGTDSQTAFFGFDGDFDHCPEDLNRYAVQCILPWMAAFGSPCTIFFSYNERTSEMARAWPAEEFNNLDTYVLNRDAIKNTVLEQWLADVPRNNPDLRMECFPEIPEKYAPDFARLFISFLRSMPYQRRLPLPYRAEPEDILKEIASRKGSNRRVSVCLVFNRENEIVGLTCVLVTSAEPSDLYQAMTGVVERYKGKGLAKWLKAKLYSRLLEEIPSWQRIVTEMRSVNEPILHINKLVGYEFQNGGHEFLAEREVLERFVNSG